MNNEFNRLDMENKQLRLQLANALDQAKNYRELNVKGSDAYNDLAKKVKNFCGQIISAEYARKQLNQGSQKSISIDEMLNSAILEYNNQKKEFREFASQLSNEIDQRDKLISDLQAQISIYEIQAAQPSYIGDIPNDNQEENENIGNGNVGETDMDIDIPVSIDEPLIAIGDDFGDMPSILPPGMEPSQVSQVENSNQSQNNQSNNTNTQNNNAIPSKKIVVPTLDEEDFIPVAPRQTAEILPKRPTQNAQATPNKFYNKQAYKQPQPNPDGGVYVPPTVESIPKSDSTGINETQKQAIKIKLANEKKQKEQKLMLSDVGPLITETRENKIWYGIMSLIGEQGISQRPKIEELLYKQESSGKTSLSTQINAMQKAGLISRENINTGYRRFIVLDLARPLGIRVFEEIFGKSPVESEVRRLTRENASKEHGYLIEDARTILLKEFGYKHVSIDRNKNTIKLNNGKKYIPDLVATIDGKTWDYMEVERGTHTNDDFIDKLNKMFMVTRTFHFIAQNKETLDVIMEKTNKWLATKDETTIKGLTIKYTTLTNLAKRNWMEMKKY